MSTATATSPGPCACCGIGAGTCSEECSSRAGSAFLCGFDVFSGIANPRQLYLTKTYSGTSTIKQQDPACGGTGIILQQCTCSGSNTYNPAISCSVPQIGASRTTTESGTSPILESQNAIQDIPGIQQGSFSSLSQSFWISNVAGGGPGCAEEVNYIADKVTESLSNMDTEQAAIARSGIAYGPWIAGAACCSYIQPRIGTTVIFSDSRLRITVTGWGKVKLRIYYNRTVYGAGSYSLYGYEEHALTLSADKSTTGSQQVVTDIPNDYNMQTCYAACAVLPGDPS